MNGPAKHPSHHGHRMTGAVRPQTGRVTAQARDSQSQAWLTHYQRGSAWNKHQTKMKPHGRISRPGQRALKISEITNPTGSNTQAHDRITKGKAEIPIGDFGNTKNPEDNTLPRHILAYMVTQTQIGVITWMTEDHTQDTYLC